MYSDTSEMYVGFISMHYQQHCDGCVYATLSYQSQCMQCWYVGVLLQL